MKIKTSQLRDEASANYAQYMNDAIRSDRIIIPATTKQAASTEAHLKMTDAELAEYHSRPINPNWKCESVGERALSYEEMKNYKSLQRQEKNRRGEANYVRPQEDKDRAIAAFMNTKTDLSPLDLHKIAIGRIDGEKSEWKELTLFEAIKHWLKGGEVQNVERK